MRRAVFAVLLAAAAVLWIFSPVGGYVFCALLGAAIISAAENFIVSYRCLVSIEKTILHKGEAPVLVFSGNKRLRGEVCVENRVTGDIQRINADILKNRELVLPEQEHCGTLLIRFFTFRRYDLLGLTSRTVVCYAEGEPVTVMPDTESSALSELLEDSFGEQEPDGAAEYRPGDQLRHVNFKLTHRFGKIYITRYVPEKGGELWLYVEYGHGENSEKAAEDMCALMTALSAKGISFGAAFMMDEIQLYPNADRDEMIMELMRYPLYHEQDNSRLAEFLGKIPEDAQVIAFTPEKTAQDDRVTIITYN